MLNDHIWRNPARRNRTGDIEFTGQVNLGAGGAIAAAGNDTPGYTVTKVAAKVGRYKVQLTNGRGEAITARALSKFGGTVSNPHNDNAYTATAGSAVMLRTGWETSLAASGSFEFQLVRSDTVADAEAMDNAKILLGFAVKFSSVTP